MSKNILSGAARVIELEAEIETHLKDKAKLRAYIDVLKERLAEKERRASDEDWWRFGEGRGDEFGDD